MALYLSNCGKCGPCGNKWLACQAQVNWHGNEPFDSTVGCDCEDPVNSCDCEADPPTCCVYGGSKYLSKRVHVTLSYTASNKQWRYTADGWVLDSTSESYTGESDNTTVVDPVSGCRTPSGFRTQTEWPPPEGGVGTICNGLPLSTYFLVPYNCGPGGSVLATPLDSWGILDRRCGFYSAGDGCNNYLAGGTTDANFADNFPVDMTVTLDIPTATHIGFSATRDYSFTDGTNPPDTPPTSTPAIGTIICSQVEFHVSEVVKIDLDIEHNYAALQGLAYALLATYNLSLKPFRDMPSCVFPVEWSAGPEATEIVLLTYKDTGCCASGNVDLDFVCDPTIDGSIVQSWVRGATHETPQAQTWGAFEKFRPIGNSGGIIVQKWALRQGNFLPYGWQIDNPKTWLYLLLRGTADLCSGAATFECLPFTGAEGHVMCISPNGDFGASPNTHWMADPFIPERTNGNDWQGVTHDVDCDRYPTVYPADCDPAPPDTVYVEPTSCNDNCGDPNTLNCAVPGEGVCPSEPADNWPP